MANSYRWLSVLLGIVACQATTAAAGAEALAASSSTGIVDLILTQDGRASGLFLESNGHPISGAVGTLGQRGSVIAKTITDDRGRFNFLGVSSGIYELRVGDQTQVIRTWEAAMAPPSARPQLTVVRSERVIRGQSAGSSQAVGGVLAVGIGLGAITVIGVEATENDSSAEWATNLPPGGIGVLTSP